ncbi:hypothetical protein AUEXF2481DRAFT_35615 [Aureobasidium subglaciale EXF-2481]|uniref:Uncharacterized protein n=1 Tax=Aureobasidium subglaciale (strain EXF-2481) TaxID=1043005 RepID=A0A074YZY7_AURSE|nr:uncharacterized protein AUEXF2481DRAFT_35615 [Aureobasidium subglaciale EXF-2481]KAI5204683.1 hypothetical protein E4T38_04645 [Aureobasidium subglaciale]KAI5223802.1 hypothetical protein E4T40_04421 [Aureobasidium subglaciale]KAI5227178.1 hypothetical protein E4T41_04452 [Aureobasidium subglaciale]KAI5262603.1 hypothetical protein E4T46_04338 [Aureobasidium subglaciale]KEQ99692.1 hypothetical protein AUEXF2481DRAFT_35615 [Aureobasidium subglaciale EXF-2481]
MGQATPAAGRNGLVAYKQALLNLAQAPRWRGLIIGTISILLVLWIWQANSDPNAPGSKLYSKISGRPQHQDFMWKPPSVLEPSDFTLALEAGKTSTTPSGLKKENPQFHLLIHAPKITSNVCRSLLSSFLLGYPTPTLIGYRPSPPNETLEGEFWLDYGLADTTEYLTQQNRISDNDFIAIVDGESTIFQLPPEALLTEYNAETKNVNADLASEYRDIPLKTANKQRVQRFNQSVFFAAEYEVVPRSSSSFLSRFRLPEKKQRTLLNNNIAVGSGSGLRHLFTTALEQNTRIERTDRDTFNTMFAQQGHLRAAMAKEQREFKVWLSRNVLPSNKKLKKKLADDLAAAKEDLGMSLDYKATMFQTIPAAAQHVADSVITLSEYLTFPVPEVFEKLRGPFALHASTPHLNSTSAILVQKHKDNLPSISHWTDIPLFTNPKTQQVPSLISMLPSKNKDNTAGLLTAPDTNMRELWESMWFFPYARPLLKQYFSKSTSKEIASEAAVGGERWYDARGGRGGVWTVDNGWLDAGELCAPFGKEIFEDGLRGWMEAVPDGVELSNVEKTPDGKGIVIGEQVRNGQIHKIVAVEPEQQEGEVDGGGKALF